MNKAIIGKKLGMSQVFTEDGIVIPVTVVEAGPCPVVQKKTVDKDGYDAVQVAFGSYKDDKRADKLTNKPLKGHYAKAGVKPMRTLKEFRLDDCAAYEVAARSPATCSRRATRSTLSAPARVTVSPVRSRDGTSIADPWLTVPVTTEASVL